MGSSERGVLRRRRGQSPAIPRHESSVENVTKMRHPSEKLNRELCRPSVEKNAQTLVGQEGRECSGSFSARGMGLFRAPDSRFRGREQPQVPSSRSAVGLPPNPPEHSRISCPTIAGRFDRRERSQSRLFCPCESVAEVSSGLAHARRVGGRGSMLIWWAEWDTMLPP